MAEHEAAHHQKGIEESILSHNHRHVLIKKLHIISVYVFKNNLKIEASVRHSRERSRKSITSGAKLSGISSGGGGEISCILM